MNPDAVEQAAATVRFELHQNNIAEEKTYEQMYFLEMYMKAYRIAYEHQDELKARTELESAYAYLEGAYIELLSEYQEEESKISPMPHDVYKKGGYHAALREEDIRQKKRSEQGPIRMGNISRESPEKFMTGEQVVPEVLETALQEFDSIQQKAFERLRAQSAERTAAAQARQAPVARERIPVREQHIPVGMMNRIDEEHKKSEKKRRKEKQPKTAPDIFLARAANPQHPKNKEMFRQQAAQLKAEREVARTHGDIDANRDYLITALATRDTRKGIFRRKVRGVKSHVDVMKAHIGYAHAVQKQIDALHREYQNNPDEFPSAAQEFLATEGLKLEALVSHQEKMKQKKRAKILQEAQSIIADARAKLH